jgi:D-inositol-3-phosphate glycosyltransferase
MHKPKIAIIEPVGGHGGMNYYDFGLASGLTQSCQQVILYTSAETIIDKTYPFQIKKTFKGVWGKANKVIRAVNFLKGLFKSFNDAKKNCIDITHFHFFHYGLQERLVIKLAKLFGFKIVITAHDVESFHGKRDSEKAKSILMMADAVIAHNLVSKRALIEKVNLPECLINVIPHGNYIDLIKHRPKKLDARQALGIDADKVILFFGQIKIVKGLDCLLEALPSVLKQYPSAKVIIAGKMWKDDWGFYEEIIKAHELAPSIIKHIHYITDEDVPNYYCAADIIALPYKEIYQSGVLLMAMSYKTPVIVSNIQGMTEVVKHNENGFVFKQNDPIDLAKQINNALLDQSKLAQIAELGFKHMQKAHNWNDIGKNTTKIYRNLF